MKYDMTNMSNMEMVSVSSMDDSASHFMGTALTVDQYNQYMLMKQSSYTEISWNTSKVIKIDNYETAQVLSGNIIEKCTRQLRP